MPGATGPAGPPGDDGDKVICNLCQRSRVRLCVCAVAIECVCVYRESKEDLGRKAAKETKGKQ